MIESFSDQLTQQIYLQGSIKGIPDDVASRAAYVLDILDAAASLEDLRMLRSLRLGKVKGVRPTRMQLYVKDGFWITFDWEDGKAIHVALIDRR